MNTNKIKNWGASKPRIQKMHDQDYDRWELCSIAVASQRREWESKEHIEAQDKELKELKEKLDKREFEHKRICEQINIDRNNIKSINEVQRQRICELEEEKDRTFNNVMYAMGKIIESIVPEEQDERLVEAIRVLGKLANRVDPGINSPEQKKEG
jgi:hypothetical protein